MSVELEIDTVDDSMVRSILVALNGEVFAEFSMPRERPHAEVRRINWLHPSLMVTEGDRRSAGLHHRINELRTYIYQAKTAGQTTVDTQRQIDELLHQEGASEVPGALAELFASAGGDPAPDAAIVVPSPVGLFHHCDQRLVVPDSLILRTQTPMSLGPIGPIAKGFDLRGFSRRCCWVQ